MHEDYIRPQENGSRCGCDYVILSGPWGRLGAVGESPFSFNASRYTQEELTQKAHNYELKPCKSTVLCLDYRQNGIGSNSCGPVLGDSYRFKEHEFRFRLKLLYSCSDGGQAKKLAHAMMEAFKKTFHSMKSDGRIHRSSSSEEASQELESDDG